MPSANTVSAAVEKAQQLWPDLGTAHPDFASHVEKLGVPDEDLGLHGHELYLAFACARGDTGALRVLEREYLVLAAPVIARVERSRVFVDEALQALRERLLVGAEPRIGQFAATGSLGAWLRVSALRVALGLRTSSPQNDGARLAEAIVDADITGLGDKERYRDALQAALRSAFEALSARQRNVLRFYYIEGKNIDRIGSFYGIHRATAARWLSSAREQIFEHVEERVRAELKISASELRSAVAGVRSQLEVSVLRLLGAETEQETGSIEGA